MLTLFVVFFYYFHHFFVLSRRSPTFSGTRIEKATWKENCLILKKTSKRTRENKPHLFSQLGHLSSTFKGSYDCWLIAISLSKAIYYFPSFFPVWTNFFPFFFFFFISVFRWWAMKRPFHHVCCCINYSCFLAFSNNITMLTKKEKNNTMNL